MNLSTLDPAILFLALLGDGVALGRACLDGLAHARVVLLGHPLLVWIKR